MGRLIWLCVGLLVMIAARVDACSVPSSDSGKPYVTLGGLSKRELNLVLDEYMFAHHWSRHSEAVSAGFREGDRVYGQILESAGQFDPEATAAWRRAYAKSGRRQFLGKLASKVDIASVDHRVVDWILGTCLTGLWSKVRSINDCRFVFTAGLAAGNSAATPVQPIRFEVRGGRCGRWPEHPLSVNGDAVQCVRSGSAAVHLQLKTDRAGIAEAALPALARAELPPEPSQEIKRSEPVSEVIRLSRSRDYHLRQLGRGCPACALYFADIRPSDPSATILSAATVSSSGGNWQRCPAGLRCGVYEFSPPEDPQVSGCANVAVCRVWRLAETDAEASDVVQLTYQRQEVVCANCPEGLDFETAHQRWQELAGHGRARCEVFADMPAQSIERAPKP